MYSSHISSCADTGSLVHQTYQNCKPQRRLFCLIHFQLFDNIPLDVDLPSKNLPASREIDIRIRASVLTIIVSDSKRLTLK